MPYSCWPFGIQPGLDLLTSPVPIFLFLLVAYSESNTMVLFGIFSKDTTCKCMRFWLFTIAFKYSSLSGCTTVWCRYMVSTVIAVIYSRSDNWFWKDMGSSFNASFVSSGVLLNICLFSCYLHPCYPLPRSCLLKPIACSWCGVSAPGFLSMFWSWWWWSLHIWSLILFSVGSVPFSESCLATPCWCLCLGVVIILICCVLCVWGCHPLLLVCEYLPFPLEKASDGLSLAVVAYFRLLWLIVVQSISIVN